MSHVHEFRVRPVQRFNLTEYRQSDTEKSSRTLGEFPNAETANEVAQSLQAAHPGSTLTNSEGEHTPASDLEFVIVEAHVFEPGALVYYAYNEQEAVIMQTNAQMLHKREFKIFSRPRPADRLPGSTETVEAATLRIGSLFEALGTGTIAIKAPKQYKPGYPSRFSIGDRALRKQTDIAMTGVGQAGTLEHFPAEEVEICGIHFYVGKVCYDVTFPSGRRGETVDSIELDDLPTSDNQTPTAPN